MSIPFGDIVFAPRYRECSCPKKHDYCTFLSAWLQARYRKLFYVRSNEIVFCPVCGAKLSVVGSRKRKLKCDDGKTKKLIVRRLRCDRCNKIHHELPDCVVPYKRYSADVISEVVMADNESDTSFSGETSTFLRLRTWFSLLRNYLSRIRELLKMRFSVDISNVNPATVGGLKSIVRLLVNSNLWPQTRLAITVRT